MSSITPQDPKPAVAKSWNILAPEIHLAIFREFLALEKHKDHRYPDLCREILQTPSNCELSSCRTWNMYSPRKAISHPDEPIDQNASNCEACVDLNNALTVCRSWNVLLKDQIVRSLPLEMIIYKGCDSLAASALHRWAAQVQKLTDADETKLPWLLGDGTDLLAVAVRRGLPDCIGPLVSLLPRQKFVSLFGGDWTEYRCYAHLAAASGNVDALRLLKLHGFNLHQEDTQRRSPICIAIRCDNICAVEYLLSIENTERRLDHEALSYAAYYGSIAVVRLVAQHILDSCQLQKEKVDVYTVVLSWSLRRLDLSTSDGVVNYCLEQLPGRHLVGMGAHYLTTAIRQGVCVKVVKDLIEKGADVNTSNLSRLDVPLETAISRGDREIIRLLLDSGAKCTPQALCLASTEILDMIFKYYVYRDIDLYQCVEIGNASAVKWLLGFENNPNPATGTANALQIAVLRGFLDIATMLLEAGANPNDFVDSFGTAKLGTPLYIATIRSNVPLIKLLLRHGADMTYCSRWHRESVLHVAVNKGVIPIIKLLVNHDDGYRGDPWSKTPLDSRDRLGMLRLVLKDRLRSFPSSDPE